MLYWLRVSRLQCVLAVAAADAFRSVACHVFCGQNRNIATSSTRRVHLKREQH